MGFGIGPQQYTTSMGCRIVASVFVCRLQGASACVQYGNVTSHFAFIKAGQELEIKSYYNSNSDTCEPDGPFGLCLFSILHPPSSLSCFELTNSGVHFVGSANNIPKSWDFSRQTICIVLSWRRHNNIANWISPSLPVSLMRELSDTQRTYAQQTWSWREVGKTPNWWCRQLGRRDKCRGWRLMHTWSDFAQCQALCYMGGLQL